MSALQSIDSLISEVEKLSVSSESDMGQKASTSVSRVASRVASTIDVAWRPIVPPGHTTYTWLGQTITTQAVTPKQESTTTTTATEATPAPTPKVAAVEKKPVPKPATAAKPAPAKAAEPTPAPVADITKIDMRVGKIVKAWKHPEADSLYVEEIDVGEEKPRQVVSGVYKYIPEDKMNGAYVVVICNLKPSALRGVMSQGMILAASTGEGDERKVELVSPPTTATPGERVVAEGIDFTNKKPDAEINPKKAGSAWEGVKGLLRTDSSDVPVACFDGKKLMTSQGPCCATSLRDAVVG